MNKKLITGLAALPLMLASSMTFASGGTGTINFSGTIISAPCNVSLDSAEQTIAFPQLSNANLDNDIASDPIAFDIKLTGCDIASAKAVSVTFDTLTPVVGGAGSEIMAGATGAAIEILNSDDTAVVLGTPVLKGDITTSDMTLAFSSHVVKATGTTNVTEGSFTATATFTLSYS